MDYQYMKKCLKALVLSSVMVSHFPFLKAEYVGRTTNVVENHLQQASTLQKALNTTASALKVKVGLHQTSA